MKVNFSWDSNRLNRFCLLLILFFGIFKSAYQIEQGLDIILDDETIRLSKGLHFNFISQAFREFFLYELWYALQSFFISDTMLLYTLNYLLLSSLCALFIYIYLGQKRGYDLITLWISLIFLISIVNTEAWPYPHRFGLIIVLLLLIFLERKKQYKNDTNSLSPPLQWLFVSLGAIALFYTRIEYIVLVGTIALGLMYKFLQSLRKKNSKEILLYTVLLGIVFLVLSYANPILRGDDRSYPAFLAHYLYSLEWIQKLGDLLGGERYGLLDKRFSEDPWTAGTQFAYEKFGHRENVLQAFLYKPLDFSFHILRNIVLLLVFTPYLLVPAVPQARIFFLPVLLLLLILAFFYGYKKGKKPGFKNKLLSLSYHTSPKRLFITGLFLSSLISFLMIHPRWAYLILPLALGFALCTRSIPPLNKILPIPKTVSAALLLLTAYFIPYRFVGPMRFGEKLHSNDERGLAGLLKAYFIPHSYTGQIGFLPSNENSGQDRKIDSSCSMRKRLEAVKNISWKRTVHIASESDPTVYLNTKKQIYKYVQAYDPTETSFAKYVEDQSVDFMFFIFPGRKDSSFKAFFRNPPKAFAFFPIKGCKNHSYLIRKSALKEK